MIGIIRTPNIWKRPAIAELSAFVEIPASTSAAPPLIVVRPAPPHEHGVASPRSATAIAVIGSNPKATRKGAAIAAGAPAPAAPYIKIGTKKPIIIS